MSTKSRAWALFATSVAAISVVGLVADPAPAQARPMVPLAPPCSQFVFTGGFSLRQSNGWQMFMSSTSPTTVGGRAVTVHDDNVSKDKGTVTGGIQGSNIDFTFRSDQFKSAIRFTGTIGDDGRVRDGVMYGQERFSWDSINGPLGCATPATPPAPQSPPAPQAPAASTSVHIKSGPATLPVGLSGTYVVTVTNTFADAKPVRVIIIFAGKLDQTGPVKAQGGLDCVVAHDAGINAAVNCTGPIPQGAFDIVVQGRGSTPGTGQLLAKLNNDSKQQNVTIT